MFYVFLGCFAQEIPRTAGYEVINTIDNISSLSFLLLPSSCELHRVGIVVFPASALVCGYQEGETALRAVFLHPGKEPIPGSYMIFGFLGQKQYDF